MKPNPKKASASASKRPAKNLSKKSTKPSKAPPAKGNKAPAKGNSRKRQVSDGSDDDESDDDTRPKRKQRKKHVDEEVETEEIVESEDDEIQIDESESEGNNQNNDPDSEDQHQVNLPNELRVKKDTTKDLLTIFSARVTVNFKKGQDCETLTGRWCMLCKIDPDILNNKSKGVRKAFFCGSNTSCRQHIRQHYPIYQQRCSEKGLPENYRAVPPHILKEREDATKPKKQMTLDGIFKGQRPMEFSQEGILDAVAKFTACDDQSLAVADNTLFRNCLVMMRPKTTKKDLPSTHDLSVYIHNRFVDQLKLLKKDIADAPGTISTTSDGWTADNTKGSFLGMTAHWIEVIDMKWKLRSEVVGFQPISGEHSGNNLARYFIGLCDHVGIMSNTESKLCTITLDNASNNTTSCEVIEQQHNRRNLQWNAKENQLPCLEHVVNLANVAVMGHITKIAIIENTNAIWEYDPELVGNRVLGGSLDVVAAIRTLAIKIQASGQRIEYFEKLQIECKINTPLKIPLHNNTRWGTAHKMLDRSYHLRQAIDLFTSSADRLYGPITTVRSEGRVVKTIPWTAFKLSSRDWARVLDARDILADSARVQHHFSAEKQPTLWRALPAIEELLTAWEAKHDNPKYVLYHDAIYDGLKKLNKYYSRFDQKPSYILAIVLHPYYKLAYIKLAWGGEEEQAAERAAGNPHAKNWQDEARKVVEHEMEKYWKSRVSVVLPNDTASGDTESAASASVLTDYERYRRTLLATESDGWEAELRRYLKDMPSDVTPETDIVNWWQNHCNEYPTLARIALDVLPIPASSVPCERLFSAAKEIADDRRSRLGSQKFEELQIMKFAWRSTIPDLAAWNSNEVDEINIGEYQGLLSADNWQDDFDKDLDNSSSLVDTIVIE